MFYYHTKVNEGSHRITVGGVISHGILTLTACRTSLLDNFCKATGRKLVKERLEKGEFLTTLEVEIDTETKPGRVFVEIARKFAAHLETELSEKRVASFKHFTLA